MNEPNRSVDSSKMPNATNGSFPPASPQTQQPVKWWWNRQYANIVLVSTGFMLVSTSLFTSSAISNNVIHDMKQYGFQDRDGYIALAIMSVVQALFVPFTPIIAATVGAKWTVQIGGIGHLLFVGSFLFHSRMLLFFTAAVFGCCFGCYWVGVGLVLAINTTPNTADKSMATFWVLFNGAQIWGNLFIAIKFNDVVFIDDNLRLLTFGILFATAVVGNVVFLFIKLPSAQTAGGADSVTKSTSEVAVQKNPAAQLNHSAENVASSLRAGAETASGKNVFVRIYSRFKPSLALATSPLILGSLGFFGFAGINLITMVSAIPTAIGFNQHLGTNRKRLIGVTGFCMGAAEMVGGLAIMAATGSGYVKRVPVYLMGITLSAIAIIFSVLNAPPDATLNESSRPSILFGDGASSPLISIACAILFGVSDAATNITMFALVADVFGHEHDELIHSSGGGTTILSPSVNRAYENESGLDNLSTSGFPDEAMPHRNSLVAKPVDNTRRVSAVVGHPPHIFAPPPNNVPAVVKLQREQATATANAVMNCTQSFMQSIMLILSLYLWFYWYLIILIPCGVWASVSFYIIDRNYRAGNYRDRFRA